MTMLKRTLLIAVIPTLPFQLRPVITLFWSEWLLSVAPRASGDQRCSTLAVNSLSQRQSLQLWRNNSNQACHVLCWKRNNKKKLTRISVTEREYCLSAVTQQATRPQSSSDCPLAYQPIYIQKNRNQPPLKGNSVAASTQSLRTPQGN